MMILETKNLCYDYQDGGVKRKILDNVNMQFKSGYVYAIIGKSGSGKTTLLSLLSGLDKPICGEIFFNGNNIEKIGYSKYRKNNVGIIFQNYNLLPYMNAIENIRVAIGITANRQSDKTPIELLRMVNIDEQTARRPVIKLSGGEQQRVAIARAIATDVELIFADEPTGNLDEKSALEVIDILKKLAYDAGKCVIIVTHSKEISTIADEVITLVNGDVLFEQKTD